MIVSINRLFSLYIISCILAISSSTQTTPWWSSNEKYTVLPENYSWTNRRTGVIKKWSNSLAIWSHYNFRSLSKATGIGSKIFPIPWTKGLMFKSLRKINKSSFELYSVYEKKACGNWCKGLMKERDLDGHMEHGHVFHQTLNRVSSIPGVSLPNVNNETIQKASTSQVTIVKKDSATFSGPRWIPTQEQARCFYKLSKEEKKKRKKLSSSSSPSYNRWQFCEMWLAEPVDGLPEGRKIGLFLLYDGMSGELTQIFRMNEVLLEKSSKNPAECEINMENLEASLGENIAWKESAKQLEDSSMKRSFDNGFTRKLMDSSKASSIGNLLSYLGYRSVEGRAVISKNLLTGDSIFSETESNSSASYFFPSSMNENLEKRYYFTCQFEDGVYIRIPRKLVPEMKVFGLELGCFTLDGNFHRLLAVGDRNLEAINTIIYEKYELE